MPTIQQTTRVKAPLERVFDLCRCVELQLESAASIHEKVVDGRTSGLLNLGDEVAWEGSDFNFRKSLRIKVSEMQRPNHFTEEMVNGAFAHMKHRYLFSEEKGVTTITEEVEYKSRGGPLGWFIENSFLTAHLRRFIADRNKVIQQVAESDRWQEFLTES